MMARHYIKEVDITKKLMVILCCLVLGVGSFFVIIYVINSNGFLNAPKFKKFTQSQKDVTYCFVKDNYNDLTDKYSTNELNIYIKGEVYLGVCDINFDGTPEIFLGGICPTQKGSAVELNVYNLNENGETLSLFFPHTIKATSNRYDDSIKMFDYVCGENVNNYYFISSHVTGIKPNEYYNLYKLNFNNQQWDYEQISSDLTSKDFYNYDIDNPKKNVFSVLQYIDEENIKKSVEDALSAYEKLFD